MEIDQKLLSKNFIFFGTSLTNKILKLFYLFSIFPIII